MYKIENITKYKVINTRTNSESRWCETEYKLLDELRHMFKLEYNIYPSYSTALMAVKQNINDNNFWWFSEDDIHYIYTKYDLSEMQRRFLIIIDNYNRFIPPYKLSCMKFDYYHNYYIVKKLPNRYYNRKKKLKEKDSGYRREPVYRTGRKRHYGRYGRRIHYKETWLLSEDDQCKEYGIKGYRPRRRLDAWDIEPVEHRSRSWKDKKIRRQWMKNSR